MSEVKDDKVTQRTQRDPESRALNTATSNLEECDERAQRRVLWYLVDRYLPNYQLIERKPQA